MLRNCLATRVRLRCATGDIWALAVTLVSHVWMMASLHLPCAVTILWGMFRGAENHTCHRLARISS
eukprot:2903839-Amphidinium_carterae.1